MTKTKIELDRDLPMIIKIVERADKMNLLAFDRLSLTMDLDCVNELFNLRLQQLLDTDNFNFSHDIVGIQNNLNRQTRQMENCFVPRFAGL